MKLIGSKMEQDFRDTLIKSHKRLFADTENSRILDVLRKCIPNMRTAYFLHHTPEQGEDIYEILVDGNVIVTVELDRQNDHEKPLVEIMELKRYQKGLSKMRQVKLAVAMDLSKIDLISN